TGSITSATGSVTGLGTTITASDDQGSSEQLIGRIETNAGVETGDSGGPLGNSNGQVVGVATAASSGFGFQDVSATAAYAIPIAQGVDTQKPGARIRDADFEQAGRNHTATVALGSGPAQ